MRFDWFAWLPNYITIGRLVLTPIAINLIVARDWRTAFFVFLAAAISDALDGFLARTFDLRSELGAWLDPIADKALIVSVYVSMAAAGALPAWLAIMVVSRDLMIIGAVAVSWLMEHPFKVEPHVVSKATTAAQLALAAGALAGEAFGFRFDSLVGGLMGGVAALTIASAGVYLFLWIQHMRPDDVR